MKVNRLNLALVVILVLQLILTLAVFLPGSSATQNPVGPLLAGLKTDNVTEITITDNNKNQLDLSKDATGQWIFAKADGYPISSTSVGSFLSKVIALNTNRLVAQNPTSRNQLHVSDTTFERLVVIKQANNQVDRLYIGSSGGANATHMRLNDQNQIYLTSGLAASDVNTTVSSWIDTAYFSPDQNSIIELQVKNAQGLFDFTKNGGNWQLAGLGANEIFNASSMTNLLNQISSVRVDTPLGKTAQDSYQLKTPQTTITVTTIQTPSGTVTPTSGVKLPFTTATAPSGEAAPAPATTTITLDIGAKMDNGLYVVKSSASTYYVEINAATAEAFVNLKRPDVLVPTPTPTATSTATATATITATSPSTATPTSTATSAATATSSPTATPPPPTTIVATTTAAATS